MGAKDNSSEGMIYGPELVALDLAIQRCARAFARRRVHDEEAGDQLGDALVNPVRYWLRTARSDDALSGKDQQAAIEMAMDACFPDTLVHCVREDGQLLWIVCWKLLERHVARLIVAPGRDHQGEEAELRAYVVSSALERTAGGKRPLEGYLAAHEGPSTAKKRTKPFGPTLSLYLAAHEGPSTAEGPRGNFWHYLRKSLSMACIDALRVKRNAQPFWREKDALMEAFDPDEPGVQLAASESDTDPSRILGRIERLETLIRTIALVRHYCETRPDDSSARLTLAYLSWLQEAPDDARRTQKAFAKKDGLPSGTVNAALYKFRARFHKRFKGTVDIRELLRRSIGGGWAT